MSVFLILGGARLWAGEGTPKPTPNRSLATFAGGCFWCVEAAFEAVPGVRTVTSGYAGGTTKHPTYDEVGSGRTGHAEVVQVVYDAGRVSYEKLLEVFWRNIDPLDGGGQFCDRGSQYRSAVFPYDEAQKAAAEASKKALEARFQRPIATEIVMGATFYPAEDYHQDYYRKDPVRYHQYRTGCGRDGRLKDVWGAEAGGH